MGSARIDALWDEVAPHVEWPDELSLVFLFAGDPAQAGMLRERLVQSAEARGKFLAVIDPASVEEVAEMVPRVVAPPGEGCGAVWISLLRRAGDPAWGVATRAALQRLNERRFLLERDVRVPMVLVLPLELQSQMYVVAPDLWSVRSYSVRVPVATATRGVDNRGANISQQVIVRGEAAFGPAQDGGSPPGRAEVEWARLVARKKLRRLSPADGDAAYQAALERGSLEAARTIATQTLAVVLSRAGLPIALDGFDAEHGLSLAHFEDPRAQRELCNCLDMLGEVEVQAGNLAAARSLFQRGLEVREVLAQANANSALAQRDLSVSLDKLGEVEAQAGNLAAARSLFQRYKAIAEALADSGPYSALAQRDLSVSLNKLGEVEVQAGNLAAARDLFLHSLEVAEGLAKADPYSALAQRDLSVSLSQLGNVEVQAGNFAAARDLLQRCFDITEALAKADPHNTQASFDVVKSHGFLAWLATHSGDRATELEHIRRAHAMLTAMDAQGQLRGFAEREQLLAELTDRLP